MQSLLSTYLKQALSGSQAAPVASGAPAGGHMLGICEGREEHDDALQDSFRFQIGHVLGSRIGLQSRSPVTSDFVAPPAARFAIHQVAQAPCFIDERVAAQTAIVRLHTCGTAWQMLSSRRASSSIAAGCPRAACRRSSALPDGPVPAVCRWTTVPGPFWIDDVLVCYASAACRRSSARPDGLCLQISIKCPSLNLFLETCGCIQLRALYWHEGGETLCRGCGSHFVCGNERSATDASQKSGHEQSLQCPPSASASRLSRGTTWPQAKRPTSACGTPGNSCAVSAATGASVPDASTTACAAAVTWVAEQDLSSVSAW